MQFMLVKFFRTHHSLFDAGCRLPLEDIGGCEVKCTEQNVADLESLRRYLHNSINDLRAKTCEANNQIKRARTVELKIDSVEAL